MTGTYCCVPDCRNNSAYNRNVSWHRFPTNKTRLNEWIRRINRLEINGKSTLWRPKPFHKICGAHFNVSGKKLPQDINPRYFPGRKVLDTGKSVIDDTKGKSVDCPCKDIIYINTYVDFDLGRNIQYELSQIITPVPNNQTIAFQTELAVDINNFNEHNYCLTAERVIYLKNFSEDKLQLMSKLTNMENQVKIFKEENEKRTKEIQCLNGKNCLLEYKCKRLERTKPLNQALKNEQMLKFYTGFENVKRFTQFVEFIEPAYNLSYNKSHYNSPTKSGRKPKLPFLEQLFLVLSRLKLGLLEQDIAYRFSVSISTISHIWSFWVDFLTAQLPQDPIWQGKELKWIVNALKMYLKVS